MENKPMISQEKTSWKTLFTIAVLSIVQVIGGIYGILLLFFNGLDTFSPVLLIEAIIILLVVVTLPLRYWHSARKNGKGFLFVFNLLISLGVLVVLVIFGIQAIVGGIKNGKEQVRVRQQNTVEIESEKVLYEAVVAASHGVTITGWKGLNDYPFWLFDTDKNFMISPYVSATPENIAYVEKNIVGRTFDVKVPSFGQGVVYKSNSTKKPICRECQLLLGGNVVSE